jgi:hypothetical protein
MISVLAASSDSVAALFPALQRVLSGLQILSAFMKRDDPEIHWLTNSGIESSAKPRDGRITTLTNTFLRSPGNFEHDRRLIVVNFSPESVQARVLVKWTDLKNRNWVLSDAVNEKTFQRFGDENQVAACMWS